MMGIDKKRAIQKKWRIRELTLFILACLGGAAGGLLGMHFFRHKTKEMKFHVVFWLALILHIGIAIGILYYLGGFF